MRRRIDAAGLHAHALAGLPATIDGMGPLPLAQPCPRALDALLAH
jgi:hypothetical protein